MGSLPSDRGTPPPGSPFYYSEPDNIEVYLLPGQISEHYRLKKYANNTTLRRQRRRKLREAQRLYTVQKATAPKTKIIPAHKRSHTHNRVHQGPIGRSEFPCMFYNADDKSVINLSQYNLSQTQSELLRRGLKYVPTPSFIPAHRFHEICDSALQRVARTCIYRKGGTTTPSKRPRFTARTDRALPLDKLSDVTLLGLRKMKNLTFSLAHDHTVPPADRNLTQHERLELQLLTGTFREHTIIQKADKGSAIVLLSRHNYVAEVKRQLNNPENYQYLGASGIARSTREEIIPILQTLHHTGYLTKAELAYLSGPEDFRPRLFYTLPKIHKPQHKWTIPGVLPPGRPIVSDVGSETYRVSRYLDYFLRPLACKHPSYIKDSFDFAKLIDELTIPPGAILVTADVESMYTNIAHEPGMAAVEACLESNPVTLDSEDGPQMKRPPTYSFMKLLELCLTRNDFYFDGEFFTQRKGVSMGKIFAPNLANIFMAQWENRMLHQDSLSRASVEAPHTYKRFLDDIFMIWTHGPQALQRFMTYLNQSDPCITLTEEWSFTSVDYLDMTLYIDPDEPSRIQRKVYHKPTDTLELLRTDSHHPRHTFKGLVRSQIIRYHRLSSTEMNFLQSWRQLSHVLRGRGYSRNLLSSTFKRTYTELLNKKSATDPVSNTSLPVTPKNTKHLSRADRYRRRSAGYPTGQPTKSRACNRPNCGLCNYIKESNTFTSTTTGITYTVPEVMTCQTPAVIYLVRCEYPDCHKQYVGMTANQLNHRFINHRSEIKRRTDSTLSIHMNSHPDPLNFSVMPIARGHSTTRSVTTRSLRILETKYIRLLQTLQPSGLNSKEELDQQILAFTTPYAQPLVRLGRGLCLITDSHIKQSCPSRFPYQPLLAYSLAGPNMAKLLTRANINPAITVNTMGQNTPTHWREVPDALHLDSGLLKRLEDQRNSAAQLRPAPAPINPLSARFELI